MVVGIPKEVKDHEARVGVTPAGVMALVEAGHKVLLETQAGVQSGFADSEYHAGLDQRDPSLSDEAGRPGCARGAQAGCGLGRGAEYMAGHTHRSRRGREPGTIMDASRDCDRVETPLHERGERTCRLRAFSAGSRHRFSKTRDEHPVWHCYN